MTPDPRDFLPQPPWEGPPIPQRLPTRKEPSERELSKATRIANVALSRLVQEEKIPYAVPKVLVVSSKEIRKPLAEAEKILYVLEGYYNETTGTIYLRFTRAKGAIAGVNPTVLGHELAHYVQERRVSGEIWKRMEEIWVEIESLEMYAEEPPSHARARHAAFDRLREITKPLEEEARELAKKYASRLRIILLEEWGIESPINGS